jgi:hypothetical protein
MSWVFIVAVISLVVAVVFVEYRAIRTGDERGHPAPGHDLVMIGLIAIGVGIAAAATEHTLVALAALAAGLAAVIVGALRHAEATAH